LKFEGKLTVGI